MLVPVIIISSIFVILLVLKILSYENGSECMERISRYIRDGARTFLKKEYKIIFIFVLIVSLLLLLLDKPDTAVNEGVIHSVSFLLGAILSMSAGYIGMRISTISNVKTAQAVKKSLFEGFKVAFSSGLVMGLTTSILGLFGIYIIYTVTNSIEFLFSLALGASSVALFARVGGGIFTKAADLGADLVGKVEQDIPEDDPRNPAVIADNVGDNVGDVAGMGADLFESYIGSIIAAMSLAFVESSNIMLPLYLACVGLISSIIGAIFTRGKKIDLAILKGSLISNLVFILLSYFIVKHLTGNMKLFISIIIGSLTGIGIGLLTHYYTSEKSKYAKKIADSSLKGVANNILSGISTGFRSTRSIMILVAFSIIISYYSAGLFGIAIAGVSMLATLGFSLSIDAYGPVADNAGGIVEMCKLSKEIRRRTDELDALGNTTAAIGKGFAIGSAALTSLALLSTYSSLTGVSISLVEPKTLIGLFIGAMLPFYFSSITIESVNHTAHKMIDEIRRQFRDKKILRGEKMPDYNKCIEISTKEAIKEMIKPAIIAIISPLLIAILFGLNALGGLLAGSLVSGIILGISLSNSGGVWDNAKKFIERKLDGRNSIAHKAAVIGDTIGDPLKDTSGPSLNILIKLMTTISLVFLPLISKLVLF